MPHLFSLFKKHETPGSSASNRHDGKKLYEATPPPVPDKDELVGKLQGLSLDAHKGKDPRAEFVGGFKHGPANPDAGRTATGPPTPAFPNPEVRTSATSSSFAPGPLPSPPLKMPFPVPFHYEPSRTMQFALSADSASPTYLELEPNPSGHKKPPRPPKILARPHSDEPKTIGHLAASPAYLDIPRPVSSPPMTPTASKTSSSGRSTPVKGGDERTQCSGTTKKGERCTRQVKADPPLSVVNPDLPVERYCYQHRKEVNSQTGFYSRRTKDWVDFSKYIPEYLHPDTQAALRIEMEKPPSQSDEPGFIYCFEIRDPDTPFMIRLKVGRTVDLIKRLNEWQRECESKEQIVRGWWPGSIMDKTFETSLLKGRVQSGPKGANCHKLERLVHLELADLVVHAPYLNRNFPNVSSEMAGEEGTSDTPRSKPGTPSKNGKRAGGGASSTALNSLQQGNDPCPDCGKFHKEIFPFTRPEDGPYREEEWEKLVKPVIEKWGWFVETLA
ncbi:hypothetical protein ACEPAH_5122 [Sanghuangporus vaninii]